MHISLRTKTQIVHISYFIAMVQVHLHNRFCNDHCGWFKTFVRRSQVVHDKLVSQELWLFIICFFGATPKKSEGCGWLYPTIYECHVKLECNL